MLLKNLMDEKKLNYNRPILSVRTHRSTVASPNDAKRKTHNSLPVTSRPPPYRSEMKSGPISNPGAVPFLWESTPGQPKDEIKPQTQNCDRPPIIPRLPPGRYSKAKEPDFHKASPTTTDHKSLTVNGLHDPRTSPSANENFINFENNKDTAEDLEASDSGDSDEAYVDALDTLSRTESCFLNCSVSGLSGMDDFDGKPSARFSRDPQTQEFMMDRFLPAAKAMASETPQYVTKKQLVVREQTQVQKSLGQDKPSLRYGPSFAKQYSLYPKGEEDEEESDDDYDRRGNSLGVCGLLPRFCLKSSLFLLNPVPAMSARTQVPISHSQKLQPISSAAGLHSETGNESESEVSKQQSVDIIQAAEFEESKKSLRDERSQLGSHSASSYCDASLSFLEEKEVLRAPEETKHVGNNGLGLDEKRLLTFQKLLADKGYPKELDTGSPVIEKTIHVDNVLMVEYQNSRPFSPSIQDSKGVPGSREEQEIIIKSMDSMHAIDSSLKDSKKFDTIDGETKFLPAVHKFDGFNSASSINKSNKEWGVEKHKSFGQNQDLNLVLATTQVIEVAEKEAPECLERKQPRATFPENSHQKYSKFPIPPPLPKSPSDSWLCRTLPSMSMKNVCRRSYLGASTNPQNQFSKASEADFKWEAIVKSANAQRRHLRSEEILMPIPET